MNELEIRKIAKEEFMNNVINNIDSSLIFTYIQNLEQKVNNLQSKIDKAIILIDKYLEMVDNPDINMQCVKDILKEDK